MTGNPEMDSHNECDAEERTREELHGNPPDNRMKFYASNPWRLTVNERFIRHFPTQKHALEALEIYKQSTHDRCAIERWNGKEWLLC